LKWSTEMKDETRSRYVGLERLPAYIEAAKKMEFPCIEVHCEAESTDMTNEHIVRALEAVKQIEAAEVTAVLMAHAVEHAEIWTPMVTEFRKRVKNVGATVSLRHHNKNLADYGKLLSAVAKVHAEHPFKIIAGFGGANARDIVWTWWKLMCRAIQKPAQFPGYVPPTGGTKPIPVEKLESLLERLKRRLKEQQEREQQEGKKPDRRPWWKKLLGIK
jgi:hypothetical protein